MKTLYHYSVWAPDAIPIEEWKYRSLTRVMFPMIDVLMIFGGIIAVFLGVPAISEFFPIVTTTLFSATLALAGLVSLIGVAFPTLWRFEICGKVTIFGLMIAYLFSLIILATAGSSSRAFLLFLVAMTIVPIVWRLSILGVEWQTRRLNCPKNNQGAGI